MKPARPNSAPEPETPAFGLLRGPPSATGNEGNNLIFGRRRSPTQSDNAGGAEPPQTKSVTIPWKGHDDEVACNLALGNLGANFGPRMMVDGRIHAETFMVGIGAIAGYCAQVALRETLIKTGAGQIGRDYHVVKDRSGNTFLFGDALNRYLVPEGGYEVSLFTLLAGNALAAGMQRADVPDVGPIFKAVAATAGSDQFGILTQSSGHTPILQPLQALDLLTPLVQHCMSATKIQDRDYGKPAFGHWPAIANLAAAGCLNKVKDVLPPRIAILLAMEAAVIASTVPKP